MADITITFPDEILAEVAPILRERFASILPEGLTDFQVVRRVFRYWLRQELVRKRERDAQVQHQAAIEAAKRTCDLAVTAARTSAETDLAG
jgi:hypothetical protein